MSSVGDGVRELKEGDEHTWYRLMYLTRIDDVIYVLHCFEKDSAKTSRRDIDKARVRLKDVMERTRKKKGKG
jgi:phage-related protein